MLVLLTTCADGFVVPSPMRFGGAAIARGGRGAAFAAAPPPPRAARPTSVVAMMSEASSSSSLAPMGAPGLAKAYGVAGVASVASWLAISYVALSRHPVASVNAACGLRHNLLTGGQALAFPLPLLWAVTSALRAAAKSPAGWDRLQSATYRRLNLGVAACSLWTAAAVLFCPTFSVGYDLFPSLAFRGATATAHVATAALALFVWARSVAPLVDAELKSELAPGGVSPIDAGNLVLSRLTRGLVGSLWSLAPQRGAAFLDDPDRPDRGAAGLWSFAAAGLLAFAVAPQLTKFPLATVPTILGKRLSRAASGFTLLGAVACYCLKDAAERGRLGASTFVTLRRGLAIGSAGHLLLVAAKLTGVDGGGLLLPGSGLWEFYPSMMAAPKALAASIIIHATVCFAALMPTPKKE